MPLRRPDSQAPRAWSGLETGAAAGAAHMGMRPVVEIQFMDFISPAYDVITNYIATSLYRGAGPMPLVIVWVSIWGTPFRVIPKTCDLAFEIRMIGLDAGRYWRRRLKIKDTGQGWLLNSSCFPPFFLRWVT